MNHELKYTLAVALGVLFLITTYGVRVLFKAGLVSIASIARAVAGCSVKARWRSATGLSRQWLERSLHCTSAQTKFPGSLVGLALWQESSWREAISALVPCAPLFAVCSIRSTAWWRGFPGSLRTRARFSTPRSTVTWNSFF